VRVALEGASCWRRPLWSETVAGQGIRDAGPNNQLVGSGSAPPNWYSDPQSAACAVDFVLFHLGEWPLIPVAVNNNAKLIRRGITSSGQNGLSRHCLSLKLVAGPEKRRHGTPPPQRTGLALQSLEKGPAWTWRGPDSLRVDGPNDGLRRWIRQGERRAGGPCAGRAARMVHRFGGGTAIEAPSTHTGPLPATVDNPVMDNQVLP